MAATIEIEKGLIPQSHRFSSALSAQEHQTPLELFQLLVGIHTPPSLTADGRRTANLGLYQRAKTEERRMRIAYTITSFISNVLFLLTILFAATITGLSSYKDSSPVTLTTLGAINTVLAGCLAWQKGQGVPQRYRKAQDHFQALVLEIEIAERSFIENALLDPRAERERLQKIYDTAKADQQANYPDLYVSTGSHEAKDLAKQLDDTKAEATKMQQDLLAKIEELLLKLHGTPEAAAKHA